LYLRTALKTNFVQGDGKKPGFCCFDGINRQTVETRFLERIPVSFTTLLLLAPAGWLHPATPTADVTIR
jgi:hypothetical protein